jgi:hypothetical protein
MFVHDLEGKTLHNVYPFSFFEGIKSTVVSKLNALQKKSDYTIIEVSMAILQSGSLGLGDLSTRIPPSRIVLPFICSFFFVGVAHKTV